MHQKTKPPFKLSRRNKAPNVPFFSQRYFIENHADLLCSLLIIIFAGTMWNRTQYIASRFFWPHPSLYMVQGSSSTTTGNQVSHEPCLFDALLLFTYTIGCISLHSLFKDYVMDKITKRVKLSKTRSNELLWLGQRSFFELLFMAHMVYYWQYSSNPVPSLSSLVNAVPTDTADIHSKLLYIFQISYWLHWPFDLYFDGMRSDISRTLMLCAGYLTVIVSLYVTKYWTLGACLLLSHYLDHSISNVQRIIHRTKLLSDCQQRQIMPVMNVLNTVMFGICTAFNLGIVLMNLMGRIGRTVVAHPTDYSNLTAAMALCVTGLAHVIQLLRFLIREDLKPVVSTDYEDGDDGNVSPSTATPASSGSGAENSPSMRTRSQRRKHQNQ